MQDVYYSTGWTGWGRDDSTLCPAHQTDVVDSFLCQPSYPGGINASTQSWTGVVCTPNNTVLCLSLPSFNLTGNASALTALGPLQDMQVLNLANNSLQGIAYFCTVQPYMPWKLHEHLIYMA